MLPELENYYSTNYSNCNFTYNYLATWQGLAYPGHIIQVIAAPIQIFTFYIILKKTPKTMNTMKCPLLVNHFWATWLDLVLCTLSTPYIFVPTISLFGVGILSYWDLPFSPQIAVVGVSVMTLASSYIYLFESRSNAIPDNRFRLTQNCSRTFYHALVLSVNLTVLVFQIFTTTEESEKLEALKIDPCPTKEFFQFPLVFFISDQTIRKFFLFFWVPAHAIQTSLNVVFHLACTVYYLFVAPPSRSISSETRQAQRRFFIGIMIHSLIPLLVLGIPPMVLIISVLMDNYRQQYTNLCMTLLGFNGLIESLAILLVHRPYRFAVKEMLRFRKSKDPKIYTVPVRGIFASTSSARTVFFNIQRIL